MNAELSRVYLQTHCVPELIDRLILKLLEEQPSNEKQFLRDQLYFMAEQRFEDASSSDESQLLPPFLIASGSGSRGGGGTNSSKSAAGAAPVVNPILLTKCISVDLYHKLRRVRSCNSVSLEDCMADGMAWYQWPSVTAAWPASVRQAQAPSASVNSGPPPTGFAAGDADCFAVFNEVVDNLFAARNGGPLLGVGGKSFMAPPSDLLNAGKITSGFQFEERFVLGACVKVRRNIDTFRMTHCTTRSERRCLSRWLRNACDKAFHSSPLTRGSFVDAAAICQNRFAKDSIVRDLQLFAAPSQAPWFARANAEWPDARGSYVSDDGVLFVNVLSGEEHVEVGCRAVRSMDVREAFERVGQGLTALSAALTDEDVSYEWQKHPKYGYLFSDLDRFYGGGVSVSFVMKLPLLSSHPSLETHLGKLKLTRTAAESGSGNGEVLVISNSKSEKPFSLMEADVVQVTCTGVLRLIELEELLRNGRSI